MMDSLYEKYVEERQGLKVLKNDHGFIVYKIDGDECFIVDMFIEKEFRGSGLGRKMISELERLANGCRFLTGNIHLKDKNSDQTLRASLACGFRVIQSGVDVLLILKNFGEVKNG